METAPKTFADLNSLTAQPLAQELDAFCRSEGLRHTKYVTCLESEIALNMKHFSYISIQILVI
jgi:hypothetical protein